MSSEPSTIRRLEESLINRIAAGEIIHRPSSALKELIENSLDAGATAIKVTVKDGGLKLLQIQDDGSGIKKSDLPILCERFTTSKLSTFADLSALTTYGFRGEALASISHVAHLSVVTKTKADSCAWKAFYGNGVLCPPKPGQSADPKPCAGNNGTLLTVEDLFYNSPARLAALRSSADEYKRILDVIMQYSVHNPAVSFQCKKVGQAQTDISTSGGSTIPQVISSLYGSTLSKELIHVKVTGKPPKKSNDTPWAAEAYISNANYQSKKSVLLLFINHRLVESPRIKKAVEAVYANILAKGSCPFVYLSLDLDPKTVDPNVHPTKKEVHFLNEESIIETVSNELLDALTKKASSRSFEYQTTLTGGILDPTDKRPNKRRKVDEEEEGEEEEISRKVYSHYKVRTSAQDRTLESMFPVVQNEASTEDTTPRTKEIKESVCRLASVLALREAVQKSRHGALWEIIEGHTFVGIVDMGRCLSLIQHGTKLYLVNHASLGEAFFYQLALRQFGNYNRIRLEPPPDLNRLVRMGIEADDTFASSGLELEAATEAIVNILLSRAEMMDEYFGIKMDSEGRLETIPLLLRDYTPDLNRLPLLMMRLGPQVDWESEQDCFETFLRELSFFYRPEPLMASEDINGAQERWQIQHLLFPSMRRYFSPPKTLLEHDVKQIANLPDLYRIFERC